MKELNLEAKTEELIRECAQNQKSDDVSHFSTTLGQPSTCILMLLVVQLSESQFDAGLKEGALHDFWEYMHTGRPSRFKEYVWQGKTFSSKISARISKNLLATALTKWVKDEMGDEGFRLR